MSKFNISFFKNLIGSYGSSSDNSSKSDHEPTKPSSVSSESLPLDENGIRQISIDSLPMMENHPERKVTIVHMSDTHISHQFLKSIPDGDILIHSGDISHKSEWSRLEDNTDPTIMAVPSIISFNQWVAKLPHKIKIVIAGNHEMGFNGLSPEYIQKKILNNVIYLQDQQLSIKYKGKELLKIYGTPWTTSSNMGFSMKREKIALKWEEIPLDTDILITHLPPYGIMDLASSKEPAYFCDYCKKEHKYRRHWGDVNLRNKAIELNRRGKLKAHFFGHVHEYHGTCFEPNTNTPLLYSNGASVLSHTDSDIKKPLVIEILV